MTVNQFGPENGARPAAQEGAGLLVRDVIGVPRQQPLKVGYEEFPAASNMVMNAIMTQDKKKWLTYQIAGYQPGRDNPTVGQCGRINKASEL